MRIEKISDTQIKFVLTQTDLEERHLKLEELITPSDKTQDLFQDIMEQAMQEYGFVSNDAPLMVEAVPVSMDGVMIIVTKLQDIEDTKLKYTVVSQNKDLHRYKRKPVKTFEPDDSSGEESLIVYSFEALDDVIHLSIRLAECYHGSNALYKYNGKYFLVLQSDRSLDHVELEDLELILGDYGQKHISSVLSKYYLIEHGELILRNSAVKTLAKNFA